MNIDERLSTWLSCFNLTAVNDEPTHLHTNGSESRLDLIIEPENCRRVISVSVIPVCNSDHRLVKVTLDCASPTAPRTTYNYRDFRRMDTAAFAAYLRKIDSLTRPSLEADEAVRQLDVDITLGLNRFAPVRTKTRRLGRHSNAWLSTEANEAKRERRRLERRYSRTRSPTDKLAYACRRLSNCQRADRQLAQRIPPRRDQAGSRSATPALENGSTASASRLRRCVVRRSRHNHSGHGSLRLFYQQGQAVKTKVESGLRNAPNDIIPGGLPSVHTQPSLQSFARVTPTEVQRLIASALIKTSPLDRLPISVVKACSDEYSVAIAHIANTSFASGRFPSLRKAGLVTPLLKKPGLDATDF